MTTNNNGNNNNKNAPALPAATDASAVERLQAQLAALMQENEALKARKAAGGKLTMKVSEKGAVSVYGLQRFPITLYANQMERLLSHAEAIKAFMKDNASKLTTKE